MDIDIVLLVIDEVDVFPDVVTVVVRFDVAELVRLVEVLVDVEFEMSDNEVVVDEFVLKDERLYELEVVAEPLVLVVVELRVLEEVGRVPL